MEKTAKIISFDQARAERGLMLLEGTFIDPKYVVGKELYILTNFLDSFVSFLSGRIFILQ